MLKILRDEKNQTRRLPSPKNCTIDGDTCPKKLWAALDFSKAWVDRGPSPAGNPGPYLKVPTKDGESTHRVYPRVRPGDLLWVREAHALNQPMWRSPNGVAYRADDAKNPEAGERWRPPMHMHRWASRITLEVLSVRAERVQEISEADAIAEGVSRVLLRPDGLVSDGYMLGPDDGKTVLHASARKAFGHGWDSIHGERASWASNPWVLVYDFRRIEQPAKAAVANG